MLIETHPELMEHSAVFQVIFILAKSNECTSVKLTWQLSCWDFSPLSLALSDTDKVCFKDNGKHGQMNPFNYGSPAMGE